LTYIRRIEVGTTDRNSAVTVAAAGPVCRHLLIQSITTSQDAIPLKAHEVATAMRDATAALEQVANTTESLVGGLELTFADVVAKPEMQAWLEESKNMLKTLQPGFGVFVDMRALKPVAADAQAVIQ
jgi:hypothetical protein